MSDIYAIYLRKSRKDIESGDSGLEETLSRHKKILTELATRNRYPIGKIYEEVVSGDSISARPQMQALLSDVSGGAYAGVLVVEVERLARGDTIDQGIVAQAFKLSGTKIITPLKTYDPSNQFDEEFFEFGLFMSRREYNTIKRRLNQGRLASAKDGKYCGSHRPYGYERVKIKGEKGYTLEPIPAEAEIIKRIFSEYIGGKGFASIAHDLDADGVKTYTGGKWSPATLAGMASNKLYCGYIRWYYRREVRTLKDGEVKVSTPLNDEPLYYKGRHPAIISEEDFEKAQAIKHGKEIVPINAFGVVASPLAGIVKCDCCGKSMYRRPAGGRCPYDILMCTTFDCQTVGSKMSLVEDAILNALREYSSDNYDSTANAVKFACDAEKATLKRIGAEEEKAKKQKSKLFDLLEQGVYTIEIFKDRCISIDARIAELAKKREECEEEIEKKQACANRVLMFAPLVDRTLASYRNLGTAAEKNAALKSVIEKVVYKKTKRGNEYKVEPFEIVLYPKILGKH